MTTRKGKETLLEKWLGVNEKLPPKSGPSKPMWVRPGPSNLYIY